MTENENLEKQIADDLSAVLKEAKEMGCKEVAYFRHIPLQNVETVVNALYEIQQYRKSLKNKHIGKDNMVISSSDLMTILNSDSEELKQYKEVGTVEECRVAVEKMKPKKPIFKFEYEDGRQFYDCPVCKTYVMHAGVQSKERYCSNCGTKLDWSE